MENNETVEVKKTKWENFITGFKKVFPWLCGGAAVVGTGVLVHKMDKSV